MSFFSFFLKNLAHPVTKSIGWQSVSSVSRFVFAFVSAILLTRYLGPEEYGFYSFVLAIVGIFTLFPRFGTDTIVLKYFTEDKSQDNVDKVFTATILCRFASWVTGFVILGALWALEPGERYSFSVLLYLFLFFSLADLFEGLFQAQYKSHIYILLRVLTEALAFILKIIAILYKADLSAFFFIICAQTLAYGVLIFAAYIRAEKRLPRFKFSKPLFVRLVKDSLPMVLYVFFVSFYMRIDQVMLSYMVGDRAVGLYAPSSQILMAVVTLCVIFAHPLQVKFFEIGKENKAYNDWLFYYVSIVTKLSYFITGVVFITASFFIPFLFGEAFKETGIILMIQIWACVFFFHGTIREREVVNHYKTIYNFFAVMFGTIINIALNFLLIPILEGRGAAIATVISFLASCYIINWLIPDLRDFAKIQTHALLLRPARRPA